MRKAEIVVLIILFSAFAYLGVKEEGRNRLVAVATIVVFAALAYGSVLQERMYRKARKPGSSIFSVGTMFRALFTRESLYFLLLLLGVIAFASFIKVMDEGGYLGPH